MIHKVAHAVVLLTINEEGDMLKLGLEDIRVDWTVGVPCICCPTIETDKPICRDVSSSLNLMKRIEINQKD